MRCPVCKAPTEVIETRVWSNGAMVRRRRECFNMHRFTTHEIVAAERQPGAETDDSELEEVCATTEQRK